MPTLNSLGKCAADVVAGIKEWINNNPNLVSTLAHVAASVGAVLTVFGALVAACGSWIALAPVIGAGIMAAVLAFADGFATGGVVPGNSFSGDNVLARVNSGEMILNRAQQARLFDIAEGNTEPGGAGGAVINQTINVQNGGDLTAITQAIKRGTVEALEFANVAYKAGAKRNKYVG